MHATFNVVDLSSYLADDEFDLGTNRLQEGGMMMSSRLTKLLQDRQQFQIQTMIDLVSMIQ